jgi:hypothetical protein
MAHKSRQPWIILIMTCSVSVLVACDAVMDTAPPDFRNLQESRPAGSVRELEVRLQFDVGTLDVRSAGGSDLFSFNLDYDARRSTPDFDFQENGDRAVMTLDMDRRIGLNGKKHNNDLSLRLNDAIPLDLDISAGVSDSFLDMTGLEIRRFHLRGGVGRTEVSFDRPVETSMSLFDVKAGVGNVIIRGLGNVHVQRLMVDGGVGGTELDFTGELKDGRIDAEINVGVGQVMLMLPREAAVTIEAEGSFLSNVDAPGFEKDGRNYTRRGSDGGSATIFIRVRSGVGGVSVELI